MANFDDMPAEIRNMVYDLLLHRRPLAAAPQTANELALFTVNKELHYEASSFFYRHNHINVDTAAPFMETATVLPLVADHYVKSIRCLTLYSYGDAATSQATQQTAKIIAALVSAATNLEELTLDLTSPLSPFLNIRVNDSVIDAAHPITVVLRELMDSRPNLFVRINVRDVWFASGIAQTLHKTYGDRIAFQTDNVPAPDPTLLERQCIGQYLSNHLIYLEEACRNIPGSNDDQSCSPSSGFLLTLSPISSPFSELDTFSAASFGTTSFFHDAEAKADSDAKVAFDEDDILDLTECHWSDNVTAEGDEEEDLADMGVDLDMDMETISDSELVHIMSNVRDIEAHVANERDVDYLANFAPHLL